MEVEIYTLNAFAKGPSGGNPAGVVLNAQSMTEEQMQETARKVGFSETAFLHPSDLADFKIRYFTPNGEVDLCGHATVAAFYLLGFLNKLAPGVYVIETKAGRLEVSLAPNGEVFLEQTLPRFSELPDKRLIADSLGLSPEAFIPWLPVQVVSTGLRDLLVPIKSCEILERIQPDFSKITDISRKHEVIGYHLFTLDTKDEAAAECRNFAPLYGIQEESATGTSNGALACYLHKYGRLQEKPAMDMVFKQGYSMNLPSEIKAKLILDEQAQIKKIQVGGTAANLELYTLSI